MSGVEQHIVMSKLKKTTEQIEIYLGIIWSFSSHKITKCGPNMCCHTFTLTFQACYIVGSRVSIEQRMNPLGLLKDHPVHLCLWSVPMHGVKPKYLLNNCLPLGFQNCIKIMHFFHFGFGLALQIFTGLNRHRSGGKL